MARSTNAGIVVQAFLLAGVESEVTT